MAPVAPKEMSLGYPQMLRLLPTQRHCLGRVGFIAARYTIVSHLGITSAIFSAALNERVFGNQSGGIWRPTESAHFVIPVIRRNSGRRTLSADGE